MKMNQQDFAELRTAITSNPTYPRLMEYRERGLSARRYRWDCLWAVPQDIRHEWFNRVYQYLNDDHIDTALRKITGTK